MTAYRVTILRDACTTHDVDAESDAADALREVLAQQDEPAYLPVSEVHQCAQWIRDNYQDYPSIDRLCAAMIAHVSVQPAPVAQPSDKQIDALAEEIARHLGDTYICGRVWSAWCVGTMSEDDFTPADESDVPHNIARAVLALRPVAQPLTHKQIELCRAEAHRKFQCRSGTAAQEFSQADGPDFWFAREIELAHKIGDKNG